MSFCCGAGMIGTNGTMKYYGTYIHNVPILFCPVCHRVEVHHEVQDEFELIAEYAHGDGVHEVDFSEYVLKDSDLNFENCINEGDEDMDMLLTNQIDMALDLLSFAKYIQDEEWQAELKERLSTLVGRKTRYRARRVQGLT